MSLIVRSLHLAVIPALIVALGCTSTSSTPEPTDTQATETHATETQAMPVSEMNDAKVEITEVSTALAPVYFDTDLAVLRPEALDALERYAKSILDHPEWGVLKIDGHCDERGSDAYNLALGKRRAAAVERHLVHMGVPASRLATRSFGARNPALRGHDEGSWRYNRRSELHVGDVLASI